MNDQNKLFVLRHCVHVPEIMRAIGDKAHSYHMFKDSPQAKFLWQAVYDHWNAYGSLPPPQVAEWLAVKLATKVGQPLKEEIHNEVLQWFVLSPSMRSDKAALATFKELLDSLAVARLSQNASRMDAESLKKELDGIQKDLNSAIGKSVAAIDPFEDWDKYVKGGDDMTICTGTPWFDKFFENKLERGQVVLYIVPTKCGKTTLCTQLVDGFVNTNQGVGYSQFEQRLEGDVSHRLAIHATGWPKSKWESVKWDINHPDVPPEVVAAYNAKREQWRKFFRAIYGLEMTFADSEGLWSQLMAAFKEAGIDPVCIIIDWWGAMFPKMLATAKEQRPHLFRGEKADRVYEGKMLHELKSCAERDGKLVIITHQISGDKSGKNAKHIATSADSQENKTLNQHVDHAVVSSKKDKQGNVTHRRDVSRSAGNADVRLKLDWEYSRFIPLEADMGAMLSSYLINDKKKAEAVKNTAAGFQ